MAHLVIDTVRQCRAAAVGRQTIAAGWSMLQGLGAQSGPAVVATLYDDEGDPADRLVVAGSPNDVDVRKSIADYAAGFGVPVSDYTGIVA